MLLKIFVSPFEFIRGRNSLHGTDAGAVITSYGAMQQPYFSYIFEYHYDVK